MDRAAYGLYGSQAMVHGVAESDMTEQLHWFTGWSWKAGSLWLAQFTYWKGRFLISILWKKTPEANASQVVLAVKDPPAHPCRRYKRCEFHPWVGKIPWRRAWNPLQCSCLENPTDRGAWQATVHRVTKSRTGLKQLSTRGCQSKYNKRLCKNFKWWDSGVYYICFVTF